MTLTPWEKYSDTAWYRWFIIKPEWAHGSTRQWAAELWLVNFRWELMFFQEKTCKSVNLRSKISLSNLEKAKAEMDEILVNFNYRLLTKEEYERLEILV